MTLSEEQLFLDSKKDKFIHTHHTLTRSASESEQPIIILVTSLSTRLCTYSLRLKYVLINQEWLKFGTKLLRS